MAPEPIFHVPCFRHTNQALNKSQIIVLLSYLIARGKVKNISVFLTLKGPSSGRVKIDI